MKHSIAAILTGAGLCFGSLCAAAEPGPPVVPVGYDAYRMWDHWPDQRIGVRAYMRSTYDRKGGNEGADASHFLFQLRDDFNVTLDVEGQGIVYFARYNHWHGSPWHYVVDGADHVIAESTTADPQHPKEGAAFIPARAFPEPLAWTWATTRGADLSWVPIGFESSFRMAYERTHYGTGYYIYHQIVGGTRLSSPIRAWDMAAPPADVMELIGRSGQDLVPKVDSPQGRDLHLEQRTGKVTVDAAKTAVLAEIAGQAGMIRAIELSAPRSAAAALSSAKLRITWDARADASVDAPIPLFFGAGTLYNRDQTEYLVKAFPVNIRFDSDRIALACYFPMPFMRSAKVELVNAGNVPLDVVFSLRYAPLDGPANRIGYFHATYQDHPKPPVGRDMVLLDTTKTEGGGDWSGAFIGTSFIFSHNANLGTLEGDPRFFFDDAMTPQAQGTGTEEWGGGGDYWGGRTMTLPFAGHPTGSPQGKPKSPEDAIESGYRFLLADLMPFGKNARIQLEHGGEDQSTEHYETVAYWYGIPAPSLIKTDTLAIADPASETAHAYYSPDASAPEEITSRYEWGPDHAGNNEVYPAHVEKARHTTGTSEFTLKLRPENLGVMLRRTLDYGYPNQRAEISIADASGINGDVSSDFKPAGIWYLAGSNVCVYSNPRDELGAAQHEIRTSNRRFRDDEFLIRRDLTQGRSSIRVRVKFTPVDRPLFPGRPVAPLAWSEIRYDAYCYVIPEFHAGKE
ncbi:MAG TPA: DUF2961 domain-containing protein [Tepidisphaeraceae bacterium]|jgi:hypothetical protein|nr:DUF2961 domain-containing protein [Tepidisphaeraceae bacterium]